MIPNMTHPPLCRSIDHSAIDVWWIDQSPITGDYTTDRGIVSLKHGILRGGKAEGVEVIEVDTGAVRAIVLPGRGMGIWKIHVRETEGSLGQSPATEFGWLSPVDGPVHPALVPLTDGDGLGWLEGFDELLVRCGLESNGAPEHSDDGKLRFPLHGRIANLPASHLHVTADPASGRVSLSGEMLESKLFFKRLRLKATLTFIAGACDIEIVDEVTNELSEPADVQMLYHINLGLPLLSEGATVVAPVAELAPKDDRSAAEIEHWNQVPAPQSGYSERVYFATLHADSQDASAVMLRNADGESGFGLTIDRSTLPYFTLWKNAAAASDGYVVGLEPATNFPNNRSLEASRGRVVHLQYKQTLSLRITLHPLVGSERVQSFAERIDALSAGKTTRQMNSPHTPWSTVAL